MSEAFRLMIAQGATKMALPFHRMVPGTQTVVAKRKTRTDMLVTFGTVEDLLADLNADYRANQAVQVRLIGVTQQETRCTPCRRPDQTRG